MSHRQYGTLKYIRGHWVTLSHVRMYNMTTLGSLFQRGWIKRNGNLITLTNEGEIAFDEYNRATVSYRKQEGEVSERVALMLSLHISKKGAA